MFTDLQAGLTDAATIQVYKSPLVVFTAPFELNCMWNSCVIWLLKVSMWTLVISNIYNGEPQGTAPALAEYITFYVRKGREQMSRKQNEFW